MFTTRLISGIVLVILVLKAHVYAVFGFLQKQVQERLREKEAENFMFCSDSPYFTGRPV